MACLSVVKLLDDDFDKDGFAECHSSGVGHLPCAGIFANGGRRFEVYGYIHFLPNLDDCAKWHRLAVHSFAVGIS